MVLGACTGDEAESTTTSPSSTVPTSTTTTTLPPADTSGDVVLQPNGPVFIAATDRGAYVAALQFLLVCTGFDRPTTNSPEMIIDGLYGPITSRAVSYAQASMRRIPTGEVDEETFAELARRCPANRQLTFSEDSAAATVAGNVAPGDEDTYAVALLTDQRITVTLGEGDVGIVIERSDGEILKDATEPTPWSGIAPADDAYRIRVVSEGGAASYRLVVEVPDVPAVTIDFGPMRLGVDGLGIARFGDPAEEAIEVLTFVLGRPDEDTDWVFGREGGRVCEGTNRRLRWVIQPGGDETTTAAELTADFSDVGGARVFAQYGYRSDAPASVDAGARALTTVDLVTIGSTLDQFVAAYGEPNFFNADLGLTGFGGMVAGITAAPEVDDAATDPAESPQYVWYIGAGEDGCLDFRE
jgi:peptidoglycan hydrolase-like protein with peptidoglycan-binding domain